MPHLPYQGPLRVLRHKIDELDLQLLSLLNDRARLAKDVGEIKRQQKVEFYTPSREQEIYERLIRLNPGPFSNEAVRNVFREIISASLSLEAPLKVVYLGPQATFTHMACMRRFGASAVGTPVGSIKAIFEEVERGRADFGVVPIENSTEGGVNPTLDLFVDSSLNIFGEVLLEVSHHLLSRSERMESIQRIYSHPHAIAQCKEFLETHLSDIPITEVASTAHAAQMAQQDPTAGAIASELAAQIYNLTVVKMKIEDHVNNLTRFLILSKKEHEQTGQDKTSLICSIRDKVGGLHEMISPFARHQINLTKIESRPSKKKAWEYLFYIDIVGHVEEEKVKMALDELKGQAIFCKVLGSYPIAQASKGEGSE